MKKDRVQDDFLEELRRVPVVQIACKKCDISRNSVYRWRKEDKEFAKLMDEAIQEGEDVMSDLGESQLLTLMKEKNFPAIKFWLSHRNPKFKKRVEVTAHIEPDTEMDVEQKVLEKNVIALSDEFTEPYESKDHTRTDRKTTE